MSAAPNRLCTIDGVLQMQDGSSVQDYLRSVPHMGTNPEVVLMSRDKLEGYVADALAYRAMVSAESDERFALAG